MRKLRELAEVIMTVNRAAKRVGGRYELDRKRLNGGYSDQEIDRVDLAVREIEEFTEKTLRRLDALPK